MKTYDIKNEETKKTYDKEYVTIFIVKHKRFVFYLKLNYIIIDDKVFVDCER